MDYEKLYKEALERANKYYNANTNKGYREIFEDIFPELKESEDERIRKEIIAVFKGKISYTSEEDAKKYIAWLEKQGEQNPANEVGNYDHKKVLQTIINEQNPLNKIEPKFKVGDWILIDRPCRIELIDDNGDYVIQYYDSGTKSVFSKKFCETHFHLWTIQDAKDGDVVVDKSDGTIGMFQSIGHHPDGGSYNDPSYCFLHCRYGDGFFYADFENGNIMDSDDAIPSTKEQHDLLFQKMKEDGYEWDSEKKELRKIEQQSSDKAEPTEHNYITANPEFFQWIYDRLKYVYNENPNVDYMLSLKKRIKDMQKPAWSEEDEKMVQDAIHWINEFQKSNRCKDESDMQNSVTCENWLKSLKDRVQPQLTQEWNEEDEEMAKEVMIDIIYAKNDLKNKKCIELSKRAMKAFNWFRKKYKSICNLNLQVVEPTKKLRTLH